MNKSDDIKSLYDNLKELLLSNYNDLEINQLKYYIAIKVNNKIISTVSVLSKSLKTWINLKETVINDPEEKVRNVSEIGHHCIGDYEYNIYSEEDLFYFNKLFKQSYEEKI